MAADNTLRERTDAIRETAYRIWQAEGCPGGCDVDHWLRAEREVLLRRDAAEEKPGDGSVPQGAPRAPSGDAGAGGERAAGLPAR